MRKVSVRMVHFLLDLARIGELDEARLLAGLPSLVTLPDESLRWFDWEDFVELQERVETALGGPQGFKRVARLALPSAYPEFRAMAAIFVSPMALFTFVVMRFMRTSFRSVEVLELERGENWIRWRESIPAADRGSETFFRISRTMAELLPRHLDLPEAAVELTPLGLHAAELEARFPPLPPLTTRGRQAVSAATTLIAGQLDMAFAYIVDSTRAERAPFAMSSTADANAAALWADKLALNPRQREFFAPLVAGRPNKEIAQLMGCSERNVEFHVGRILRAAHVSSRSELLVKVLGSSG